MDSLYQQRQKNGFITIVRTNTIKNANLLLFMISQEVSLQQQNIVMLAEIPKCPQM
jgi:hypothetical protein